MSHYDAVPSFEDFAYASSSQPEADDDLHDPGPKLKVVGPDHRLIEPRAYRRSQGLLGISWNGLLNLVAIGLLGVGLLFVFGGLPVYSWITKLQMSVRNQLMSARMCALVLLKRRPADLSARTVDFRSFQYRRRQRDRTGALSAFDVAHTALGD